MKRLLFALAFVASAAPLHAGDIHRAVEAADLAQVRTLLAADPSLVHQKDDSQYRDLPLHVAAAIGHVEIAELLVKHGAAIDAHDTDRSTPLHVAAVRRQPDMVVFLIAQGADLAFQDDNGAWSLSFAASAGDSLCCRLLMDAGAPLDLVTAAGQNLLHMAMRSGRTDVFDAALAAGADPEARVDDGYTLLHFAAMNGQVPMMERLLAGDADLNVRNDWGSTPLHETAWRGRGEAGAYLIGRGAEVNAVDDWARTPLWIAAGHGQPELAAALLASGADPNRGNDFGQTPLMRAAQNGHLDIVNDLLDAGARPDAREARTGGTPLHAAAMRGYGDVVGRLASCTPNLNACDGGGATAATLAARYGHASVVAALNAAGARQEDPAPACPAESACLAACAHHAADTAAPAAALAYGEARYWYLGHAGYAVQTRNHLLIFDYWTYGRAPDAPALCNGRISPAELADQNVTVFISHEHGDHCDPAVFDWAADVANIRFLTGCDVETDVGYRKLDPREVYEIDGLVVRTIASNDSGLGYLVEADGLVVFHAGDHANRLRDFSGPYCAEIDWLAETAPRPDLAVMPVSGCGFGDLEAVRLGVHYAFDALEPRVFLPAHAIDNEWRYREFVDAARELAPQVRMVTPAHRGDHFEYAAGRDVASR